MDYIWRDSPLKQNFRNTINTNAHIEKRQCQKHTLIFIVTKRNY